VCPFLGQAESVVIFSTGSFCIPPSMPGRKGVQNEN